MFIKSFLRFSANIWVYYTRNIMMKSRLHHRNVIKRHSTVNIWTFLYFLYWINKLRTKKSILNFWYICRFLILKFLFKFKKLSLSFFKVDHLRLNVSKQKLVSGLIQSNVIRQNFVRLSVKFDANLKSFSTLFKSVLSSKKLLALIPL